MYKKYKVEIIFEKMVIMKIAKTLFADFTRLY